MPKIASLFFKKSFSSGVKNLDIQSSIGKKDKITNFKINEITTCSVETNEEILKVMIAAQAILKNLKNSKLIKYIFCAKISIPML